MTAATELVGWMPVAVRWDGDDEPTVEWCFTEGRTFNEPFFNETLDACKRDPFRLLFRARTPMSELGRFVARNDALPLGGFVFHMSRCGSTLISQMLAAMPEHLVLSEPPPIDAVLRAPRGDRRTMLRWVVAAMGQARASAHRRLFVKFDAWSSLDLGFVRATFPDVRCLFVYRDPVEVLTSHSRRWGAHVIPGVVDDPRLGDDHDGGSLVDHAARVLARICEAGLAAADDPMVRLVNYRQLPEFFFSHLAEEWSLTIDEPRLRSVARLDAKNPAIEFARLPVSDDDVPFDVRAAAERWLVPVYERLEAARVSE